LSGFANGLLVKVLQGVLRRAAPPSVRLLDRFRECLRLFLKSDLVQQGNNRSGSFKVRRRAERFGKGRTGVLLLDGLDQLYKCALSWTVAFSRKCNCAGGSRPAQQGSSPVCSPSLTFTGRYASFKKSSCARPTLVRRRFE
jgi:hypothetical protein